MAKKFRTKIVEIEATQFTGDNHDEMENWTEGNWTKGDKYNIWGETNEFTGEVFDFLHDTWIGVKPGQWIVRGVKGEYYPCDDETFHWKYEEI